jgi:Flp pilus assembly pilin Flp
MVPAMTRVLAFIVSLASDDQGQDLLEYAMLMALIAVAAILTVTQLGQTITNILWAPIVASNI